MKIVITDEKRLLSILDNIKLRGVLISSLSKFRDRIPHVELRMDFQNSSSGKKLSTQKIIGSENSISAGCRIIATLKNTSVAMVSTSNENDLDSILGAIQRLRNRIDRIIHEQPTSHQNKRFNLGFST